MSNLTYEDKSAELEDILVKYRAKWQLDALAWLDYSDVCQIIRFHIFKKWHLWDQERPFKPWAAMVASHQIKNLIRNHYSNFTKPCLRCEHNLGGDGCAISKNGLQNEQCAMYAKWKKKKESAYNLKLALPIEDNSCLGESFIEDNIDFEKAEKKLHLLVLEQLNEKHKKVYTMLYIDNLDESVVAKHFKFKRDSSKRKTVRYKQISNLKKKFFEIAKTILKEEDVI